MVALNACQLPTMDALLRQQRLMYFRRFVATTQVLLHRLAQATAEIGDGFAGRVLLDVKWLCNMQGNVHKLCGDDSIDLVIQAATAITKTQWKAMVAKAVRKSIEVRSALAVTDPYLLDASQCDYAHACPECSACFESLSALASHRFRKHQVNKTLFGGTSMATFVGAALSSSTRESAWYTVLIAHLGAEHGCSACHRWNRRCLMYWTKKAHTSS